MGFSGVRESLKPGNDQLTVDVDDVQHELEVPAFPNFTNPDPETNSEKEVL